MSETGATQPGVSRRRGLLYAAVAVGAALAGAGLAWRRLSPGEADGADTLWPMSFDSPSGSKLEMSALRGKPLLVNFWATWCAPCVEEMPMLDSFYRENAPKGWQVVGLAIDQPSAVRSFLARTPVTFPIGLAGFGGSELSKQLGNLTGGLPFTVVIGSAGQVLQRRIGRVTKAELARWQDLR